MDKKMMYAIDGILLVLTVFVIAGTMIYVRPTLTSPEDGFTTTGAVLFKFAGGDAILIDDNLAFSSPERYEAARDVVIRFEPGVYYWKVEGVVDSEVRQLTIRETVDLRVQESGEGYELVNAGNVALDVEIYEHNILTGSIVLKEAAVTNATGDTFIGGKHD